MSFLPLPRPDVTSLASLIGSDVRGCFRAIVTVAPYGESRHTTELFVWIRPSSGVIQQTAGNKLIGERRVGVGAATNLDPFDNYCLIRSDFDEEPLARLFDHLAGPAAYAYGGVTDPMWRRVTADGGVVFYRRGPLRLRARFDAATRLPESAWTESGVIRWDYSSLDQDRVPAAPDVSSWRLEETQIWHIFDPTSSFDIGTYLNLEPIDAMIRHRLDPVQERTSIVYRTSSMAEPFLYATWRLMETPEARVRFALGDRDTAVSAERALGGFEFIRAVRSGDRIGRVSTRNVRYLEFADSSNLPLEVDAVADEPSQMWRSRVASLVSGVVEE